MTIGSGAEKCQATWFERPKTKRAQHHSKVSFALQNVQRDSYGLATLDRAENPVCCHRENNEITRGNSYSTLWHVSARADSNRGYDALANSLAHRWFGQECHSLVLKKGLFCR